MEKQTPKVYVSQSKRRKIIQKHSNAIAHYQPLIEQRFSELKQEPIAIGKVTVKDMRDLSRGLRSYSWQECRSPSQFALFYPLLYVASIYRRNQAENDFFAHWFNRDLYLSFNHGTEILQEFLDQTVVHELSHGLWERLKGITPFDSEAFANPDKFKFANEGFASYCEYEFFRDLYPQEIPKNHNPHKEPYIQERSAIERLVNAHGEKILLEIPKNWRELT